MMSRKKYTITPMKKKVSVFPLRRRTGLLIMSGSELYSEKLFHIRAPFVHGKTRMAGPQDAARPPYLSVRFAWIKLTIAERSFADMIGDLDPVDRDQSPRVVQFTA